MRVALRLAVAVVLLVVAAGCASLGQAPSLASGDNLVWDCGWRALP